MTFSLLGADPERGEVGMVVTSSSPAVAARCAYARAGVGVAASQNLTDPRLGPELLDALAAGMSADVALASVRDGRRDIEHRQLAVLDATGAGAAWSGARTLGVHGRCVGERCVAAGNLLASDEVIHAMVTGFEARPQAELVERLLDGLGAGLEAGGEAGPVRSAGLLVARDVPWPVIDLRVDHSADPVGDLVALWAVYAPQRDAYMTRALDPSRAPAFDVPGEKALS